MFVVLDINVCCAGYQCLLCWILMFVVLDINVCCAEYQCLLSWI